jgi:hypothetical protein
VFKAPLRNWRVKARLRIMYQKAWDLILGPALLDSWNNPLQYPQFPGRIFRRIPLLFSGDLPELELLTSTKSSISEDKTILNPAYKHQKMGCHGCDVTVSDLNNPDPKWKLRDKLRDKVLREQFLRDLQHRTKTLDTIEREYSQKGVHPVPVCYKIC